MSEPNSRFKFLWIDITFQKGEQKWYRLVIILLALITMIVIFWKLKEWTAPAIALEKLSHFKLSNIISLIKSKAH
jgi:hypothetical protein